MFLFETILFYNGVPSYYNVYQQASKFYFEASPVDYYKHVSFPNFNLTEVDHTWQPEGVTNQSLVEQAIDDLLKHAYLLKPEISIS